MSAVFEEEDCTACLRIVVIEWRRRRDYGRLSCGREKFRGRSGRVDWDLLAFQLLEMVRPCGFRILMTFDWMRMVKRCRDEETRGGSFEYRTSWAWA